MIPIAMTSAIPRSESTRRRSHRRMPSPSALGRRSSSLERVSGGFGGTALVAGARRSFRGKDAGSARTWKVRARLRTQHRGEQSVPAAQLLVRESLLLGARAVAQDDVVLQLVELDGLRRLDVDREVDAELRERRE